MNIWYVGAILSIIGSIISNFGVNVQKYSFKRQAIIDEKAGNASKSSASYWRQPLWALGLVGVIGGSLLDFGALALAAQSIIAPMASVSVVVNMIFAHYWLKENVSRLDMIGTALIVGGSVITVAFGNHDSHSYSIDQIREVFSEMTFAIYMSLVGIFIVLCYVSSTYFEYVKCGVTPWNQTSNENRIPIYSTTDTRMSGTRISCSSSTIAVPEDPHAYKGCKMYHAFALCALSGTLGAQSVLFGKIVAELLVTSIEGNNQMTSPWVYVFVVCMVFFILTQIHFLSIALLKFDALYCVPIFQCFYILISAVGGAVFFKEFSTFSVVQAVMFFLGISLTLGGVFLLSRRHKCSATVMPESCITTTIVNTYSAPSLFVNTHSSINDLNASFADSPKPLGLSL